MNMNECAICLRKTRHNRMTTPCGHAFHSRCMATWTSRKRAAKNTCPMCRALGMKFAVQKNFSDDLLELKSAIIHFWHLSRKNWTFVQLMRRIDLDPVPVPDYMNPKVRHIVKTVLFLMYFTNAKKGLSKELKEAYLNVQKKTSQVDRKVMNAGFSLEVVYPMYYNVLTAREEVIVRAFMKSIDVLFSDSTYVIPPPRFNANIMPPEMMPDFAFIKKLLKVWRGGFGNDQQDLDKLVKELTKARKQWRASMVRSN